MLYRDSPEPGPGGDKFMVKDFGSLDDLESSDEDLEDYYDDDPQQILHEFIERRAEKDQNLVIDYDKVLKDLDAKLPPIPDKPEVEVVNPPPYNLPRIQFGKLLPKPEVDPKDKKKKPPQKRKPPKQKKDEKPKKIYPYEEYPPKMPEPDNRHYFDKLKTQMNENTFPKHFKASQ